jgi:hypothetical protein
MPRMDSLSLVAPVTETDLLPLVPDAPWASMARAAALTGGGDMLVDNPAHPSVSASRLLTASGPCLFLFGDPNNAALADFVRTLSGPVTVLAPDEITAQIPMWRSDAIAGAYVTLTFPSSGEDAVFVALPPGGVRRLRPNDVRHLAAFPPWLWDVWGTPEAMLRAVPVYARYLRGELVSLACVTGETEHHAAIGAFTIERTRRNGFARDCVTRLVGAVVNERGKRPTFTVPADDVAAIGLARSLGMTDCAKTTGYVIP